MPEDSPPRTHWRRPERRQAVRDARLRTEVGPEIRLMLDDGGAPAPAAGGGRVEFRVAQ
jgi:hypothetical protein